MKLAIVVLSFLFAQVVMAQPVSPQRLHEAATRGDTKAIAAALESGTPVDAVDRSGQTALLLAVTAGQTEAARLLLQRGASVNAQAVNHDTPWLLAGALGGTVVRFRGRGGPVGGAAAVEIPPAGGPRTHALDTAKPADPRQPG